MRELLWKARSFYALWMLGLAFIVAGSISGQWIAVLGGLPAFIIGVRFAFKYTMLLSDNEEMEYRRNAEEADRRMMEELR